MLVIRSDYIAKILKAWESLPLVVLTGARQVGKTSIMKMISVKGASVFLNGQDPEIAAIFQQMSTLKDYLQHQLNNDIIGTLFIDEFQFIPGISTMLKLLTDLYPGLNILCSGSSSLDIAQKVEESIAGRVRLIDVYSLSFEEYLLFTEPDLHSLYLQYNAMTSHNVTDKRIEFRLREFLLYGGLPRIAVQKDPEEKISLLDDIYKTYLIRDVRTFIKVDASVPFDRVLRLLAYQNANLVNINEISRSSGLAYRLCEEYIYLLEQMNIIRLVGPFDDNKRKAINKMKKVYFTDTGLRNVIARQFPDLEHDPVAGSLFENFVFLELKKTLRPPLEISYFRTYDGAEIDFVVNDYRNLTTVEAKYKNISRTFYLPTLKKFNSENKVKNSYLVNKNFNVDDEGVRYIQGYLLGRLNA